MITDNNATCTTCGRDVEHVPGIEGSVWHTPFWRHADTARTFTHPAVPAAGTVWRPQVA